MEHVPEHLLFFAPKLWEIMVPTHTKYGIPKSGHRKVKILFNNNITS